MATTSSPRGARRAVRLVVSTPTGAIAAVLLAITVLFIIIGPIFWGDLAEQTNTQATRQTPSAAHLLGTDRLGRDILARVLAATRPSIVLALSATAIGVFGGILLGVAPLMLGRRIGRGVTAFVNMAVAFPGLLLAFMFSVIFGIGARGAVLGVGLAMAPAFARLTQTVAFSTEGRDYIAAARVAGVNRVRIVASHVLPNIAEPVIINAAMFAGSGLVVFASLSFLGLGVQKPDYDWGVLLVEGVEEIYTNPMAAFGPGIAIVIAGLAFNLVGESVAKAMSHRHSAVVRAAPRARPWRRAQPAPLPTVVSTPGASDALLSVADLQVTAYTPGGVQFAPVRGVSFEVRPRETVGIVGESGSGKSLTALAVAGLLERPLSATGEHVRFAGMNMLEPPKRQDRRRLGLGLAVVFQDPMTALNPSLRIGTQLAEVVEQHQDEKHKTAWRRVEDKLAEVGIPEPHDRARQYPHEFSGGMRQRAVIAMGLMGQPQLIIADEPTTALDVTVQKQVLDLLETVRQEEHLALLMISHDLLVVGQVCDRVLVMYAGRVVEEGPARELLDAPSHPYTAALLAAVPDMETDRQEPLAVIPGGAPDPTDPVAGCSFAPRCAQATEACWEAEPPLMTLTVGTARRAACWFPQVGELEDGARVGESSMAVSGPA